MLRLIKFELKKLFTWNKVLIILILLIVSSFGLIKFSEYLYNRNNNTMDIQINYNDVFTKLETKVEILKKQYEQEPTANNFWLFKREQTLVENYKYLNNSGFVSNDWRGDLSARLSQISIDEISLNMYKDGIDMKDFTVVSFYYNNIDEVEERLLLLKEEKEQLKDIFENGYYYDYIETLVEKEEESLEVIKLDIERVSENAILPNYNAVSRLHQLETAEKITVDSLKLYDYIINNKIKDQNDWRYVVIQDIIQNLNYEYDLLDTEEEFQYNPNKGTMYLTYEDYLRVNQPLIETAKTKNLENWYYLNHNIKPLTLNVNGLALPYSSRLAMNNVYYVGIVSLIITSIICAGIVANEHKTGTIRLLLTKPFKRWKVLLSKLLVTLIVFLATYLIGFVITYLISGFMYGFSDFSIPLLLNHYGNITITPYLTFVFNNIAKAILISILVLSILFCLSSTMLNTSLSLSIVLISIFIFTVVPYAVTFNNVFNYIPLSIINMHEVIYSNFAFNNININISLICSAIYSLMLLVITFIIYCKRDVKN